MSLVKIKCQGFSQCMYSVCSVTMVFTVAGLSTQRIRNTDCVVPPCLSKPLFGSFCFHFVPPQLLSLFPHLLLRSSSYS